MIDLPIGKAIVAYPANRKCGYICEIEKERREKEMKELGVDEDYYDEDFDYLCKTKNCCKGCGLEKIKRKYDADNNIICEYLCCNSFHRKDGKNVFYKIVDYPFK
jgi:hypothetical protein